jgi:hypothetical protein
VVVKRECLNAVGPYDESFTLGDEYDMFLRVAKRFQCRFVDKDLQGTGFMIEMHQKTIFSLIRRI